MAWQKVSVEFLLSIAQKSTQELWTFQNLCKIFNSVTSSIYTKNCRKLQIIIACNWSINTILAQTQKLFIILQLFSFHNSPSSLQLLTCKCRPTAVQDWQLSLRWWLWRWSWRSQWCGRGQYPHKPIQYSITIGP